MILKTHQVVAVGAQILLAQLHHGIGPMAGARIDQAHRFHRTKPQRVASAARYLLDGQAGFEKRDVVRNMGLDAFGREQRVDEALVLITIEGTVQVIIGAVERFAVARGAKRNR